MARKKRKIKRHLIRPDKKFGSVVVSRLINKVMRKGEKRTATKIVYQAAEVVEKWFEEKQVKLKKEKLTTEKMAELKKMEEKNPSEMKEVELANQPAETESTSELLKTSSSPFLTVLEGALANIKPGIEMKRRKQGSASYRVPKIIDEVRALKIALQWLVEGAKERREKKREERRKKERNTPNLKFEMFKNLAEEIKDAYSNSGEAFKKKESLYKEAEAGKVFATAR